MVLHFLTLPPLPFRAHLLLFTNISSVTQASLCLELVSQGSFSSCTQGSTGLLSNKFSVGYILSCLFVINYHFYQRKLTHSSLIHPKGPKFLWWFFPRLPCKTSKSCSKVNLIILFLDFLRNFTKTQVLLVWKEIEHENYFEFPVWYLKSFLPILWVPITLHI